MNPLMHLKSLADSSDDSSDETLNAPKAQGVKQEFDKILKMVRRNIKMQKQFKEQPHSDPSEVLDLKTELIALKQKGLQNEREKSKEVTKKNIVIAELERRVADLEKEKAEDNRSNSKIIEALEKDIEETLQKQITENNILKQKL